MSISFKKLIDNDFILFVESEESVAAFKELVHRGTNLWPDAPPEIKAFADRLTNADWMKEAGLTPGALQDYDSQNTSKLSNRCRHYKVEPFPARGSEALRCLECGAVRENSLSMFAKEGPRND